jgi:quercetin dioxygenase-like cupin family protein
MTGDDAPGGGAPAAAPFTVDWSTLSFSEVRPGIHGATVHTPQLTVTYYRYEPGSSWEEHHHPEDQVTSVVEGEIDFVVAGEPVHLRAGELAALPGGVPHSARVGACEVRTLNVYTSRGTPAAPSAPRR